MSTLRERERELPGLLPVSLVIGREKLWWFRHAERIASKTERGDGPSRSGGIVRGDTESFGLSSEHT